MTHKDGPAGVQNERLTVSKTYKIYNLKKFLTEFFKVAVRVRPPSMSMDSGAGGVVTGNGFRVVTVANVHVNPNIDFIFKNETIFKKIPKGNWILSRFT